MPSQPTQHHAHAVVWIDHREARVFHVGLSRSDEVVMHSHLPEQHIHHKANSIGSGHTQEDTNFLKQTVVTIRDAEQIVLLGPSTEKLVLHNYIREHEPKLASRIVAVESTDHPTDRQIIAHAKQFFKFVPARST